MLKQNYKNRHRIVPLYRDLTFLGLVAGCVLAVLNIIRDKDGNRLSLVLFLLVILIVGSLYYHVRTIALNAQYRAIRAEENLRHTLLTGNELDSRLTIAQIIELRFASDEELPDLSKKAADENLSSNKIKESIKFRRNDHYLV